MQVQPTWEILMGNKRPFAGRDDAFREDPIFTKSVKAGRRTYFFDVHATRSNQYYLTITESKKYAGREGSLSFEKHKIYLYGEDFDHFKTTMQEVMQYIEENTPSPFFEPRGNNEETSS